MEPIFIAKNVGAKIVIYDNYLTLKSSFLSKETMIPFKEISSVESSLLYLEINTKDRRDYKISLKNNDKKKVKEILFGKLAN